MRTLSRWGVLALLGLPGGCSSPPASAGHAPSAAPSALESTIAYRVKDLQVDRSLAPHFSAHALGPALVLAARDATGHGLWRSDGTEEGTVPVLQLPPDTWFLGEPALLDGALYFQRRSEGQAPELWKLESATATPSLVRQLPPPFEGDPSSLLAVGDRLYFTYPTEAAGQELWVSDGTAEGTKLLADLHEGPSGSRPRMLHGVGGALFFVADDGVHGEELWRTDGTAAGTHLVRDIHPTGGAFEEFHDYSHAAPGALFFTADDGVHGRELWRSDGTSEGTRLVKDLVEGPWGGAPGEMASLDSTLFFLSPAMDQNQSELWRTQGSAETTTRVSTAASWRGGLAAVNGALLFASRDPLTGGFSLWRSDGTEGGTVLVKELSRIDVDPDGSIARVLGTYEVIEGLLVFVADDGVHGLEPWRSDGTPEGTYMISDVFPGAEGSDPAAFTLAGDTLYFSAREAEAADALWAVPMEKLRGSHPPTLDAGVPPQGEPDAGTPDAGAPDAGEYGPLDDVIAIPISAPASGCASTSGTSATGWLALLGALAWMRRRHSAPPRPDMPTSTHSV